MQAMVNASLVLLPLTTPLLLQEPRTRKTLPLRSCNICIKIYIQRIETVLLQITYRLHNCALQKGSE